MFLFMRSTIVIFTFSSYLLLTFPPLNFSLFYSFIYLVFPICDLIDVSLSSLIFNFKQRAEITDVIQQTEEYDLFSLVSSKT